MYGGLGQAVKAQYSVPSRREGPVLQIPDVDLTVEEMELAVPLAAALLSTVRAARKLGKYDAYSWVAESPGNQVAHAAEHLRMLAREVCLEHAPDGEAHAEHAVARLAIFLALRERQRRFTTEHTERAEKGGAGGTAADGMKPGPGREG